VATYISNLKNALKKAKDYESEVDNRMKEVVFRVYTEYEKVLISNNAMDFDDILIKVYNVLNIPQILEIYQERYKYIMVDEYQDTNLVQYNIVKLLASKYQNLAVV
jgi:DNA helicase-2/ATP-dependent DNA helicase PcrA